MTKLNELITTNKAAIILSELAAPKIDFPRGDKALIWLSALITASPSLIAASMAVTEKTPPEATKPTTKSFKF